jgi:hypothetical protein
MADLRYPQASCAHADLRRKLTPDAAAAFSAFSEAVFR